MSDATKILTADEVAAKLRMSVDWIYAETREGRIPHFKLGRRTLFREATIDAWIKEREAVTLRPSHRRPRDAGTSGGMATGGQS